MFPRTGLLFRKFVGKCVLIAQGLIRCSVFCALGPQCFQRDSTYYLLDSPWPLEPAEIFFFRYHLVVAFGQTFFSRHTFAFFCVVFMSRNKDAASAEKGEFLPL